MDELANTSIDAVGFSEIKASIEEMYHASLCRQSFFTRCCYEVFLRSRPGYHGPLLNNRAKTFTRTAQEDHGYECFRCQKESLSPFYKPDLNDSGADVEVNVNSRQFERAP